MTEDQAERLVVALERMAECHERTNARCDEVESKWGSMAKRDLMLRQMARDGAMLDELIEHFDLGVSAVKNVCVGIKKRWK